MASIWLDRLSNSNPSSRRGSPAPRLSNAAAAPTPSRPSLDSRSTSLSVLTRASSSTSSLPTTNAARSSATSALRNGLSKPTDVQDPFQVLEGIIGHALSKDNTNINGEEGALSMQPVRLEDEVDFRGLSLSDYISTTDEAKAPVEVTERSIQTVEEYEKERGKFEDLHQIIARCDEILKSVETSLANFQSDLGAVSTEIESLQDRSTALTTRLGNRKIVEQMLGPAAEDVSISPAVVRAISEGPINDDWLRALAEFEKRGSAIDARLAEETPTKAAQEVRPILDNLRSRANERVRDHIVAQIKAMRSPNINAQIIQHKDLAKYKNLFTFLARHQKKLSGDIVQAYVNTMRWYYLDNFTRYRQALEKLKVVPIGKEDTIGSDPSTSRGARPGAASALFDLGRRGEVLSPSNTGALSSYLASEDKMAHHLELPYRNFLLALVDNASAEYHFLTTFFAALPYKEIGRRASDIFGPTLALFREMTQSLLETSSLDCLGILLCIRVTQRLAFELQRRRVPVLDDLVNGLSILLWPAFQKAMDSHTESIKACASTLSAKSAASKLTFNMTGSSGGGSDSLAKASMAPHFLTQRFGQFLYGILTISRDSGDDEPVASSLARMRSEYDSFMSKAAKSAGGADKARRERFLANQLILIETIVSDTEGKLAADVKAWLEETRAKGATGR